MKFIPKSWVGMLLLCVASLAQAHVDGAASGFMSGLLHPVFGLDHFLAMLSVGIVSAQLGGRRIFTIPATFVGAMIVGGIVGAEGIALPFGEFGIAFSVIVLGIAVVTAETDGNSTWIMLITAFFGFLHGHAHGLEMPKAADPVFYAAGFVASTAMIHLLGVVIGHYLTKQKRLLLILRHMGSAMAGMGILILAKAFTA